MEFQYRDDLNAVDLLTLFDVGDEERLFDFPERLHRLVRAGWVQRNRRAFRVHPLLQEIVLKKLRRKFNSESLAIHLGRRLADGNQQDPFDKLPLVPLTRVILAERLASDCTLYKVANVVSAAFMRVKDWKPALEYQMISYRFKRYVHRRKSIWEDLSYAHANLFQIHRSLGNIRAARYHSKQDLDAKREAGITGINLAKSLDAVGLFKEDLGKYTDALSAHQQSIVIKQALLAQLDERRHKLKGDTDGKPTLTDQEKIELELSLAVSYNNIALAFRKCNKKEEAVRYNLEAIAIRERNLHPNHPDLAQSYGNYADTLFFLMDSLDAAMTHQKKAVRIHQSKGRYNPALAISLNTFAQMLMRKSKGEDALRAIRLAIKIRRIEYPKDHFLLAPVYRTFAEILKATAETGRAKYYIDEAVRILSAYNPDHPLLKEYVQFSFGLAGTSIK